MVVRVVILKRMRWAGDVPWVMGKNIKFVLKGPHERFSHKSYIVLKLLLNIL
jgi:hypothetical protein